MFHKLIFILLLSLLLISCKKDTTAVDNEDSPPPGYQEDIPWPSLADSPWPRFHGDAQSTGRSKYPGPVMGDLEWSLDSVYSESGVVIGLDSTVFFIGYVFNVDKGGLCSYSSKGTLNWIFELDDIARNANATTPLVTADGTIIVSSSRGGKLFAVNQDGTMKWEYDSGEALQSRGMNIGLDGTIYIVDSYLNLHSISSDGDPLWQLNLETNHLSGFTTSFSPDGTTLYIVGGSKSLYAVDVISHQIKWIFGENGIYAAPVVDSDGNIYIMGTPEELANEERWYLCKLDANGNVIWRFFFGGLITIYSYSPTIDKFGNLYFAPVAQFDSIYSVNTDGQLRWKKPLDGACESPIVCDVNNVVYVAVAFGIEYSKIQAFSSTGELLWQTSELTGYPGDSPALGINLLYFNMHRISDYLYVIK